MARGAAKRGACELLRVEKSQPADADAAAPTAAL